MRLSVTVKSPATRHELAMAKLESCLVGGAKSPNHRVMKNQLREIAGILSRNK
jgi:hypothetical protein